MVGIALRVTARGRLQINSTHRTPADRDNHLGGLATGLMLRRITHDARHHNRVNALEAHRLG